MRVILWEFRVRRGFEQEFERAYGPRGVWAEFFQRGEGYQGTELLRDLSRDGRYVTIDRWASKAAYDAFRDAHRGEYEAIDGRSETLTESERHIGTFSSVATPAPG